MDRALIQECLDVLRRNQWVTSVEYDTARREPWPYRLERCPDCGGLNPATVAYTNAHAAGHADSCSVASLISKLENILNA